MFSKVADRDEQQNNRAKDPLGCNPGFHSYFIFCIQKYIERREAGLASWDLHVRRRGSELFLSQSIISDRNRRGRCVFSQKAVFIP
jgi:hypothetical protein